MHKSFSAFVVLSPLALVACAGLGNPMGGGNPQAVSRAVTTASGRCTVPLGTAEIVSEGMLGMPSNMSSFMPGGDSIKTAASVAQHSGCFSVIADDAGAARARVYNGSRAVKPDYIISVNRQMSMPTYGGMMGDFVLNVATFGGAAMSGNSGPKTTVTVKITSVHTYMAQTGSATDHDAGVATVEAMKQALAELPTSSAKRVVSR